MRLYVTVLVLYLNEVTIGVNFQGLSSMFSSPTYAKVSRTGVASAREEHKAETETGVKSAANIEENLSSNESSDAIYVTPPSTSTEGSESSHLYYSHNQNNHMQPPTNTNGFIEDGRSYRKSTSHVSSENTYYGHGNSYYSKPHSASVTAQDRYLPRNVKKGSGSSSGSSSGPSVSSVNSSGSKPAVLTSYDADISPKGNYKPFYNQAEPPPYPPLTSSDTSNNMNTYNSNSDSSSFYDFPYGFSKPESSSSSDSDSPSDSYLPHKPSKPSSEEEMTNMPSKPDSNNDYMSYMPKKPDSHKDYMSYMPPKAPSDDSGDDYLPYKPDHILSYNPEDADEEYFSHKPSKPESESKPDDADEDVGNEEDHYLPYMPQMPTKPDIEEDNNLHVHYDSHKPYKSKPATSNSNSDDEFYFHYPVYKPSMEDDSDDMDMHKKPSSSKKKPAPPPMDEPPEDSSDEDDSHHPESKPKYKHPPPPSPPSPEIYYSKPPKDLYKPMHDYDSYIEDDEHKEEHHPDHDSDYRVSKRPYSYYYLGRKLWYVPLWFAVYFIIYVTALILKSIARHKINYPIYHWKGRSLSSDLSLNEMTKTVTEAINREKRHYM